MGVVWRGCIFVKKTDSQDSTSCFESESLWRMWSGNLHFNKVPRCLPCILESLNLIHFWERRGCWGESKRGKERRQTDSRCSSLLYSCPCSWNALLVIWWNTAMQNGYNFQTATHLASHSGKMSRQGSEGCFIQPSAKLWKVRLFQRKWDKTKTYKNKHPEAPVQKATGRIYSLMRSELNKTHYRAIQETWSRCLEAGLCFQPGQKYPGEWWYGIRHKVQIKTTRFGGRQGWFNRQYTQDGQEVL